MPKATLPIAPTGIALAMGAAVAVMNTLGPRPLLGRGLTALASQALLA